MVRLPATFRLASFNPGGEAIVSSLTNLWVIDPATEKVASRAAFPASTSSVVASPDGATVLVRSGKVLGAYDTASGMLRWQVRASGMKNGATRCSAATVSTNSRSRPLEIIERDASGSTCNERPAICLLSFTSTCGGICAS